ncbi:MAG: hypothetical protein IIZ45_04720, partial [Firmicutes bacterium]|nr:hypothetical protein [Bacillota bacterium]
MKQIALHLVRTVFLPMGSPPIGRIDDVKADLAKAELRLDGKKLYCMGQLDVLVDYTSLAASAGRRLFADGEEQGKAWQALLDLPFALSEDVFCPPGAEISASLGRLKWFMVAPRAFELEADILAELPGRDIETEAEKYAPEKKDGGWQMVSCEDVRKEEAAAMTEVNAAKDEAEAGAAVVKNCGGKEDSPLDRAIAKIKESAAEEMNERTEGDGLCAPAEETPPAGERTAEDGAAEKEVVR